MTRIRRILVCLLALALIPASAGAASARHAMVAAADARAAQAGMAVLREGGTAMDAAVAVQMVLGVVEPQSSGLGGGAVMLHYDAGSRAVTGWDGRETAPEAAGPALFLDADGQPLSFYDAVLSGRSVGVPGTLRMLELAHRRFGRLPWARLLAPAIALAASGFEVSPRLAAVIAANADKLLRQRAARDYFLLPDGSAPPPGRKLLNPALAETLRAVAAGGADAFYRGRIAADIAAAVRADPHPGGMTVADLAGYQAKQRPPVCGIYRLHRVCGMGPPSSGGVGVLEILGVLAHFDLRRLAPDGADAAFLLGEAERLAYADRNAYLADSDQVPVPVDGLIDPSYLALRAQLIDPDHAIAKPRPGNPDWSQPLFSPAPAQPEHGTSQVAIVDAEGNAVSLTTTVEDAFGARMLVDGFVLNNELTDFSFRPSIDFRPVGNRVAPGKRPRSSMAPTLVFDPAGRLELVLGSQGGGRIIGFVAQMLVSMLDWDMTPQAAAARPHVQSLGGAIELEAGTAASGLTAALQARGQTVEIRAIDSGQQAIRIAPDGTLLGGADPRREGAAVGD